MSRVPENREVLPPVVKPVETGPVTKEAPVMGTPQKGAAALVSMTGSAEETLSTPAWEQIRLKKEALTEMRRKMDEEMALINEQDL